MAVASAVFGLLFLFLVLLLVDCDGQNNRLHEEALVASKMQENDLLTAIEIAPVQRVYKTLHDVVLLVGKRLAEYIRSAHYHLVTVCPQLKECVFLFSKSHAHSIEYTTRLKAALYCNRATGPHFFLAH